MVYKRKEGFRFAFEKPVPATFKTLAGGRSFGLSESDSMGHILDISPRGMKLATEVDISEHISKHLQLAIHFVLDTLVIRVTGEIIWRKSFGQSFQYGIKFTEQPAIEELIISELKSRRKKEVLQAKKNVKWQ